MEARKEGSSEGTQGKVEMDEIIPLLMPLEEGIEEEKDEDFSVQMQKIEELMKIISQEATQLNEVLLEERKLVTELCSALRLVLSKLHISLDIPPRNIPQKRIKKLILNEYGQLIVFKEDGGESAAFLAEYPPEIIMSVLWYVAPTLARVIARYKRKVNLRISFFKKLKKELMNMVRFLIGDEKNVKR